MSAWREAERPRGFLVACARAAGAGAVHAEARPCCHIERKKKKGPRGPLPCVSQAGEGLDDADDLVGEGRRDRQTEGQQEGRGDLVEEALEARKTSERHDTHTFEFEPPGERGRLLFEHR